MNHEHRFVEEYQGMLAYGLDRKSDEETVICYLQKFSADDLMKVLIKRLSDTELEDLFNHVSNLLRDHLTEPEYHRFFLKD